MKLVPTAHITEDAEGFHVTTHWDDWHHEVILDRPCTHGWLFGPNKRALARRLCAAINAGVVHTDAQVATDVNGKTYVAAHCKVLGRHANADLKRLGF